ncbi:MAG: hypothetical protein QG670_1666 [Thermoproteota archaeon]|nr:hypothetical protein [Thermoproteota archaeon]
MIVSFLQWEIVEKMSGKNVVDGLLKRIEELESQAITFKEHRNNSNDEAKKWAERRDLLNSEYKKVRAEVDHFRAQRDQMNQAVKALKNNRIDVKTQLESKWEEYKNLREKHENLLNRTSGNQRETERQIKALDWRIQTNPLNRVEENQIINQIKILESESLVHKKASVVKEKIIERSAEIGALRLRRDDVLQQVSEYATRSQEYHNLMLEKIKEAERIKNEADKAHQEFVKCRGEADNNHTKYSELLKEINELNLKIRELEETTRKKRINDVLDAHADTGYKKLKERKKLTFEEFKALMEKGRI